jgi:hypothetical protein
MWQKNYLNRKRNRSGIAMMATLIFILVFMALATGMLSMSSHNTIAASNHQAANLARSTAECGLEVIRYWVSSPTVYIPGIVSESDRYSHLMSDLQDVLNHANINYSTDGTLLHIGSPDSPIMIDGAAGRSFYARVTPDGTQGANILITGQTGKLSRTLNVGFTYGTRPRTVFDFGVATKGPLSLGNTLLDGVNASVEADVYIESLGSIDALDISNAQIAGNVKIVNPGAVVSMSGGQSTIGGESGTAAIDNHVEVGVPATEFPYPDAKHFEQYATGGTITAADSKLFSKNITFENVRIAAGTNPKFTGGVNVTGVLYIESPNVVEFASHVNITGLIVGDGDYNDNSETNRIDFSGTVISQGVTQLPADSKFDSLRQETGTFLMAPGFAVKMGGNFGTLNGCIVGNGIEFYGNAGGEIGGSIVNYSTEPMNLRGSDLLFNKSGITELPAGFISEIVVHYNPASYSEVCGQ